MKERRTMMTREEALALLKEHVKERHNLQHALESEAVMRALAERLGADPEVWGLCGLLHDLDWEMCSEDPSRHGLVTEEMLADADLPEELVKAIPAHNGEYTGRKPESDMARALIPAETVTGLIIATVLVRPDKDISKIPLKSLRKKFKDKSFARNVSRDAIRTVEDLGVPLDEFLELARDAIAGIQDELGLR